MENIAGKAVAITGASFGPWAETARHLVKEGSKDLPFKVPHRETSGLTKKHADLGEEARDTGVDGRRS